MYKIKIEDLKTGTVEIEIESDCILAVINLPKENAAQNFAASRAPAAVIMNVATNAVELSRKAVSAITADLFGGENE